MNSDDSAPGAADPAAPPANGPTDASDPAQGDGAAAAVLADAVPGTPERVAPLFPGDASDPASSSAGSDPAVAAATASATATVSLPSVAETPTASPATPAVATPVAGMTASEAPLAPRPLTTAALTPSDDPAVPAVPDAAEMLAAAVAAPAAGGAALSWVDLERFADTADVAEGSALERSLLADAPHRSALRPAVVIPMLGVLAVVGAYAVTTALWPLNAVKPTVTAVSIEPAPAPAPALTWPAQGSAAVGIEGIGAAASTESPTPMASITKLVTVLAALERMPLAPGQQGPSFSFTQADSNQYWAYRESDQSSLDVPVDGTLTEYQLLQGILLGSANNYADRLAKEVWGSTADYVAAGQEWLRQHDITGISLENPSGFGFDNVATPRALIQLGQIAVNNPVIGEIVRTKQVMLPGAGLVTNTNGLLGEDGIIGVKTGSIGEDYNLLSAKEIQVDGTTVRIYVAMLAQDSDESRLTASRDLYGQVEKALHDQAPTVSAGTVVGTVDTAWGAKADVVAGADGRVVLWNGAAASATTRLALGDDWTAGGKAGSLSLKGPLGTADVDLKLGGALDGPGFLWRFTHPLELFGITR